MTKVGEYEYQDSSGNWHTIDLYEPGTFYPEDPEPLWVQLSDGSWGVPSVVEPDVADTPIEFQMTDGTWMGVASSDDYEIDYFGYSDEEWYNLYHSPSVSDYKGTSTSSHTLEGDYLFFCDGWMHGWSNPGMGLPNYPSPGDRFEFNMMPLTWSGAVQYWLWFGGTSNYQEDGSTWADEKYQIEFIDNGTFRLQVDTQNSRYEIAADFSISHSWDTWSWYKVVVDWFDQEINGRTGVKLRLYDTAEATVGETTPMETLDTAEYTADDRDGSETIPQETGRIGFRSPTDGHFYIDKLELHPAGAGGVNYS